MFMFCVILYFFINGVILYFLVLVIDDFRFISSL